MLEFELKNRACWLFTETRTRGTITLDICYCEQRSLEFSSHTRLLFCELSITAFANTGTVYWPVTSRLNTTIASSAQSTANLAA